MLLQSMMVRHLTLALAALTSVGWLRAATLQWLSLDDMIQKSTAIVRGHVTSSFAAFRGK